MRQAEQVVPSVVKTYGNHEVAGRSWLAMLKSTLKDKQLLLVLDNGEQVVEEDVQIAEQLAEPVIDYVRLQIDATAP